MRTRRCALPAVFLAALGVAGCGGDDDFEPGLKPGAEGIIAVIETYAAGLADGDGPRACSLMSKPAQQALIDRSGGDGNCLAAITATAEELPDDAITALRELEVGDITGAETTSASASVTLTGPGADAAREALGGVTFQMSVTDARWGIESVQP